ncbi:hypothetical protein [Candidatus Ferrigenium straubiae]
MPIHNADITAVFDGIADLLDRPPACGAAQAAQAHDVKEASWAT